MGAGDIATCRGSGDERTAALLDSISGTVFTTGDHAYPDGSAEDFSNCYDSSWGRHKARTRPSPGNHDYHTVGAASYFEYFGRLAGDPSTGFYSYDLGDWHVIALNSEIDMSVGSPQERWLRADLAANKRLCTIAYWHKPRFSSAAKHGSSKRPKPLWDALYEHHAEVVVNGHDHIYERFAPQTPEGALDQAHGIRQFTVGTGGARLRGFSTLLPTSEAHNDHAHGVLKLTLLPTSYRWEFVPVEGATYRDSGSGVCHEAEQAAEQASVELAADLNSEFVVNEEFAAGSDAFRISVLPAEPVLVGAGNIARCSKNRDEATAQLLDGIPGTVVTLGDNVYDSGSLAEFQDCYGPAWGRHKARTRPVPGNHEYRTEGAAGYFDYFGAAAGDPGKGYYSYDIGAWHIIALNSRISMRAGSAQERWLRADLAASNHMCTLAYFHDARFYSAGRDGVSSAVKPVWDALYEAGAEIVLSSERRFYERYALQTPDGDADPVWGIRQFIVGTGGWSSSSFGTIQPNSEVRETGTRGVLKLTLHSTSYEWEFIPIAGQTFSDSGSGTCHGRPGSAAP